MVELTHGAAVKGHQKRLPENKNFNLLPQRLHVCVLMRKQQQ
jgi:hypothetical protein